MSLIWATRGRSWGFRFLRDGGFTDPLPAYERAFAGIESEPTMYRRVGKQVALRFPDPKDRCDEAGRVIPHDIVVMSPLADDVRSVEDGQRIVWPLLAEAFARLWDLPRPPSASDLREAVDGDPSSGTSRSA
ncbi:hypothetical protein [Myceligenerans indicum]|uniref:Uncharacterized protein n=1 Tax=Myceligenerans indicum TaxID=2593663 RepID=A0ABS1LQF0_9MICO|nr:hypothetical protein [Myceligenerans indicum]MBL0888304.1 hypothetical protein [Myceligenerans indicum]